MNKVPLGVGVLLLLGACSSDETTSTQVLPVTAASTSDSIDYRAIRHLALLHTTSIEGQSGETITMTRAMFGHLPQEEAFDERSLKPQRLKDQCVHYFNLGATGAFDLIHLNGPQALDGGISLLDTRGVQTPMTLRSDRLGAEYVATLSHVANGVTFPFYQVQIEGSHEFSAIGGLAIPTLDRLRGFEWLDREYSASAGPLDLSWQPGSNSDGLIELAFESIDDGVAWVCHLQDDGSESIDLAALGLADITLLSATRHVWTERQEGHIYVMALHSSGVQL